MNEPQEPTSHTLTVAAVGDLHCRRTSQGMLRQLFVQMSSAADLLLLCGDLTDNGLPDEAHVLRGELARPSKPVLAVLGNHDFESGQQDEVSRILGASGINVLDGATWEGDGLGVVGVRGFGGGFGRQMLQPWGEPAVKDFVAEASREAMKLESALSKLSVGRIIAILHYSPIAETVEGEPRELYPFLGSSRLEEPLNRFEVAAAFHGHSHHGRPEGRTREGVPVFNVAMPLLLQAFPDRPPFRVFTLPRAGAAAESSAGH